MCTYVLYLFHCAVNSFIMATWNSKSGIWFPLTTIPWPLRATSWGQEDRELRFLMDLREKCFLRCWGKYWYIYVFKVVFMASCSGKYVANTRIFGHSHAHARISSTPIGCWSTNTTQWLLLIMQRKCRLQNQGWSMRQTLNSGFM